MCPNCCLNGVDCSHMHPKTDRQVCFILCLTAGGILFLYKGCHSVMLREEQQNGKMVLWCTLQILDTGRRRAAKLRINTHVEGHLSKGTKLAHWTMHTGCSKIFLVQFVISVLRRNSEFNLGRVSYSGSDAQRGFTIGPEGALKILGWPPKRLY